MSEAFKEVLHYFGEAFGNSVAIKAKLEQSSRHLVQIISENTKVLNKANPRTKKGWQELLELRLLIAEDLRVALHDHPNIPLTAKEIEQSEERHQKIFSIFRSAKYALTVSLGGGSAVYTAAILRAAVLGRLHDQPTATTLLIAGNVLSYAVTGCCLACLKLLTDYERNCAALNNHEYLVIKKWVELYGKADAKLNSAPQRSARPTNPFVADLRRKLAS